MAEKWTTEKVNKLLQKKLAKSPTFSWPNLPQDSCHMCVNDVIVARNEDCEHGQLGDVWKPEPKGRASIVTGIDHEKGEVTFDMD